MKRIHFILLIFLILLFSNIAIAKGEHNRSKQTAQLAPVVSAIDYHTRAIYLFNYETDQLIIVNQLDVKGWRKELPLQHTAISPDAKTLWITTDSTLEKPSQIMVLDVLRLNWDKGRVNLRLVKQIPVDWADRLAELPFVEPVNDIQNIPDWISATNAQIHAPSFLPYSDFLYWTEYTSDKVRVLNAKNNRLAKIDPVQIEGYTEQTHGVVFNKSGSIGLGSGYWFDNNVIDVYAPNKATGALNASGQIMLGTEERHGAMTHYVYWLNERYAVTATMQHAETSTSTGAIIPPAVWLLDAIGLQAIKIIDSTDSADGAGVFRSVSDMAAINNKLYIAEEDSLDFEFAQDGYISVFDISDIFEPVFIKRFKPGEELPAGYAVAHTISPTPDNRNIIVASWVSGYVLRINTITDQIEKIWGPGDGLVMPHGIFAAGSNR